MKKSNVNIETGFFRKTRAIMREMTKIVSVAMACLYIMARVFFKEPGLSGCQGEKT